MSSCCGVLAGASPCAAPVPPKPGRRRGRRVRAVRCGHRRERDERCDPRPRRPLLHAAHRRFAARATSNMPEQRSVVRASVSAMVSWYAVTTRSAAINSGTHAVPIVGAGAPQLRHCDLGLSRPFQALHEPQTKWGRESMTPSCRASSTAVQVVSLFHYHAWHPLQTHRPQDNTLPQDTRVARGHRIQILRRSTWWRST